MSRTVLRAGADDLLPPPVRRFLLRALLLFIFWKALYIWLLLPLGEPDGWLVRQLAVMTAQLLNLLYGHAAFMVDHDASDTPVMGGGSVRPVSFIADADGRALLGIHPSCNGLELMVLAGGFLVAFRGPWKRKALFVALSVCGIFAFNVARCLLLTTITVHHPDLFEFMHRYFFSAVIYSFTFLVWMSYIRGLKRMPVGNEQDV